MEHVDDRDFRPYTVDDLAEITGEGPQVIRDAALAGKIPGAFRFGRRWLFARPRIHQLLREGRAMSGEDIA